MTRPARRCKTTTPIWLRCAAPVARRPLQPSLIGLFTDAPASISTPTWVPHCAWQCIEELRGKREELNTSIATDEEEKGVGCLSGREPRVTLALYSLPVSSMACCA